MAKKKSVTSEKSKNTSQSTLELSPPSPTIISSSPSSPELPSTKIFQKDQHPYDLYLLIFFTLLPSIYSLYCIFFKNKLSSTILKIIISFSILFSIFGFYLTNKLIPVFASLTLKAGLCGKDLGKKGTPNEHILVPEALGLVCGIIFILCAIAEEIILYYSYSFSSLSISSMPIFSLFFNQDLTTLPPPHYEIESLQSLMMFNSALFSICFMILLGFMDDTLELKWRYKLFLPTLASLPLLLSYSGSTTMYLPSPLNKLLITFNELTNKDELTLLGKFVNFFVVVDLNGHGNIIELGSYFLLFMGLQAVFCTNSINILAGINGLESGQSFVIGASLLFFKLYELVNFLDNNSLDNIDINLITNSVVKNSIFTLLILLPFLSTTFSLLRYNWYPSKVFVGDTYCYFAGMTYAVIGIHSHYSKTILLLFIPQIINFLLSVPQLFKIIPCPRHRLPTYNIKTKKLNYSVFACKKEEYKLFKLRRNDEFCPNYTLLNLVLIIFGPMTEKQLSTLLWIIQLLFSILAFYIRYYLLNN